MSSTGPPEGTTDRPAEGRVTLILTSPRAAVGLLSWAGWQRLRAADAVLADDLDPAWSAAFEQAAVRVRDVAAMPVGQRAGLLVEQAAAGAELVWWGSPDGDPGLTDALAEHLSRRAIAASPPQVEVLTASHDVPGARLLDLVAVMDTLRSPGGCPWDAEQTHISLLPYLLEETHEVIEAVESGDRDHLLEELGDLLFQIVFHSRLAAEDELAPFDIDQVAAGVVAKLIRRHPHVFGDEQARSGVQSADLEATWEQLKAVEKPGRALFEGIPATLPALAKAQKMLGRLARSRSPAELDAALDAAAAGDELAGGLLRAVRSARDAGNDAEAALRAALARLPGG